MRSLLLAAGAVAASLADEETWVHEVLRVSDGDPFYIKLLVEDVLDGRLEPEEIGTQPTGLDEYLKGWWDQLASTAREAAQQDTHDLLGSLAAARGRLGRNDLVAMFPKIGWALDRLLKETGRFVTGNEREGYALSHPRFADFIRGRIGPSEVQFYSDALLAHCANWSEHRSPYALRYFSGHLLAAHRFRELLELVDRPFLDAKFQHFHSYLGILNDVRNAVHAAGAADEPVKMLGLALAHAGLEARIAQPSVVGAIPLYARFGEPDRALEFADALRDETQRAKTLIAIARELMPSAPDRGRDIIRRVLANWRRYPKGYECGIVLSQVLSFLPDELTDFLDTMNDFSPVASLGKATAVAYRAVDQSVPELDPGLRERLRSALARALTLPADEHSKAKLRFLLARLEPDPTKADPFADGEAARLIIQARRDVQQSVNRQLSDQTVQQTLQFLLGDSMPDEKWPLLYEVAVPHFRQFLSAALTLDPSVIDKYDPVGRIVDTLIAIGAALVEQTGDADGAKNLLFEAMRIDREFPSVLLGHSRITRDSQPGLFSFLVERISERLATVDLGAALIFLNDQPIAETLSPRDYDEIVCYPIWAAAQTNPDAALQATERHWRAKAIVAEEIARTDLERAITVWRALNPGGVDKPELLVRILHNAPPAASARAREVLDSEFQPQPADRMYRVPVLLDVAVRLREHQPDKAREVAEGALDDLRAEIWKDRWAKPEKALILARLVPTVAKCGLIHSARDLVDAISSDYGLRPVAAADVLAVLTDSIPDEARQALMEDCELKVRFGLSLGFLEDCLSNLKLTDDILHFHTEVRDNHWGLPGELRQFGEAIVDLVELTDIMDIATLTGLNLVNNADYESEVWSPDHAASLLASKTVAFYKTSAFHFVSAIRNDEIRQLAIVDLCGKLPREALSQLGDVQQDIVRAIGLLRLSVRHADPGYQQELLGEAFAQAEASLEHISRWFTMDLVVQFAREAFRVDPERAKRFSRQLIASLIGSSKDWGAHRLYELAACGYALSAQDRIAAGKLSDQFVGRAENPQPPMRGDPAHDLAARYLTLVARSMLLADRERGLMLVDRAAAHALAMTETNRRLYLQRGLLRTLLASGDEALWKEAVRRSLDSGDSVLRMSDRFSRALLERRKGDPTAALSMLEVMDWAEQLMKTGLRG